MKKQSTLTTIVVLATTLCFSHNHQVSSQFLQSQSPLSRIVQSITSPLVLSSSAYPGMSGDSEDSYSGPEQSYYSPDSASNQPEQQPLYHQQSANDQGSTYHQRGTVSAQGQSGQQYQPLQQAPSQQRGVPQRYRNQENDNEDRDGDERIAPSNSKESQEYQMGAYLGPTIDDKELNQAFNSNDDRDDDDMPATDNSGGYRGSPRKSASSQAASGYGSGREGNYGSPTSGSSDYYARNGYANGPANGQASYGVSDESSNAYDDDEDSVRPRQQQRQRGAGYRGGALNQAASQYQQHQQGNPANNMVAAANGYAPYGYAGPIDLGSILAGGAGGNGFQVYNGDGSYPAGNPNFGYQQQNPRQRGSRNQAESMNNYGYYNNGYGQPVPGRQQQQQANEDNDQDNDVDED